MENSLQNTPFPAVFGPFKASFWQF